MKKSKILGIALAASLVASMAAISVNAEGTDDGMTSEALKSHKVGLTGSFNAWAAGEDLQMTETSNGVYEATIKIDSVTEDMVKQPATSDGGPTAGTIDRGISGIQFKVRLDGEWTWSWGDYEAAFERTENSQTNCVVAAVVGQPLTIKVKFDSTTVADWDPVNNVAADHGLTADDDDAWNVWPVTYEVVTDGGETSTETSTEESTEASTEESTEASTEESTEASTEESTEASTEESKESAPAQETSEDVTPVTTGDTTSAVALVAVVVASLGAAVVMTKKASSKE